MTSSDDIRGRIGDQKSLYTSGEYRSQHPTWGREDSAWKMKYLMRVLSPEDLARRLGTQAISVVDVGCGAGGIIGLLVDRLIRRGWSIKSAVGYDIAEHALELARKEWTGIEFVSGSSWRPDARYDLGLLIDVVEHVDDPCRFIQNCARRCKYLVFHIPLDESLNTRIRNQYEYLSKRLGHIHYYHEGSAIALLQQNGQEIIRYVFTPGFMLPSSRLRFRAKLVFLPRLLFRWISERWSAKILGGYSVMVLTRSTIYEEEHSRP